MENVITVIFPIENEAYRAFSEIRHNMLNPSCIIAQLALVKKQQDGKIVTCDTATLDINANDDTFAGGLIGMLVGTLGGPVGMILGGTAGTLAGMASDSIDDIRELSLVGQVSTKLLEGDTALIALAEETDETVFNARLSGYQTTIIRHDAAVVAAEVERASEVQAELAKEAVSKMYGKKKEEIIQAADKKKAEVKAWFTGLKEKIAGKGDELKGRVTESLAEKGKELQAKSTEIRDKVADSIAEVGKGIQSKELSYFNEVNHFEMGLDHAAHNAWNRQRSCN